MAALRFMAVVILVLAGIGQGCDKEEARYVRPSTGCKCADKKDGSKCQCNHCMGENTQGKKALCYCGEGGCGCSAAGKTKCSCGHCLGEADDAACGCKK